MFEIETVRQRFGRPALVFEPTSGAGPCGEGPRSWFGAVTHQCSEESWPHWKGTALRPLLQLVLADLPYRPRRLQDVAFLTMFVHPEHYPDPQSANGTTWLLRTSPRLDNLVPVRAPEYDWSVKRWPLDFALLVEDYPCREHLPEELSVEQCDEFERQYATRDGIKIGGWPRLLRSEIAWMGSQAKAARPEYVLQVDSMVEFNWSWGDVGCAYIARGTAGPQKNDFFIDWQCF